jgi:lipopolysaccharide/colanic/teichoic acid biosynthesis glycosyltransferase
MALTTGASDSPFMIPTTADAAAVTTGASDSPFMTPTTAEPAVLTPDSLAQALSRPQVARGRRDFEARMVERAHWRSIRADAVQRVFDVTLAGLAIALATPLLLLVAAAVRLTSPGPVIFRQTRIGRHGEPFECMKFRTMRTDAAERLIALLMEDESARAAFEQDFKLPVDPRITRIGRLLRRSSLDELPQLFNVLRGDMSLVGPRPVVPEELGRYGSCAQVVLQVRPGITGAWQVNGRNALPYPERVRLDVDYALNRSLALDIGILRRTIRCVVHPEPGECR